MAVKVIKFPCPNAQQFVLRAPGTVVEILHFQAQIMRESALLDGSGKAKANMMLGIWVLIDDEGTDEDHQFLMVQTGIELPAPVVADGGELSYIGTTTILLPTGQNLEFNLFYAGQTFEFAGKELPKMEAANDG